MPSFSKTQLLTVGLTLAVIWTINNVDALDVVKEQMNFD